ncbi:MAG: c-type cytochrome [Gemmataceae bacterium]|nr:c-type cytochrome [Gemmataceae bacterium]
MRMRPPKLVAIAALTFGLATARSAGDGDKLRDEAKRLFGAIKAVPQARLADPDVTLGHALFWDTRLSANGKVACASCHMASDWGADARRFSVDAKGKNTGRNSQTVLNAMLQPSLRWTGDRKSGAHQAEKSLTGSMGFASADVAVPLLKKLGYEAAFKSAFPKDAAPVSPANYAKAIEAYQATLLTPAPFDRFLEGQDDALNAKQQAGLKEFLNHGCAKCHSGPLLGGGSIRKFGVEKEYWTATKSEKKDAGLFTATKKEADLYKFRVSNLRNVAKTGPYFHDGSVADLKEAVQVMADVQLGNRLSDADAAAIVAFLETLTGDVPRHYGPPKQP